LKARRFGRELLGLGFDKEDVAVTVGFEAPFLFVLSMVEGE